MIVKYESKVGTSSKAFYFAIPRKLKSHFDEKKVLSYTDDNLTKHNLKLNLQHLDKEHSLNLRKIGGSLTIILPTEIVKLWEIEKGDKIDISVFNDTVFIEKKFLLRKKSSNDFFDMGDIVLCNNNYYVVFSVKSFNQKFDFIFVVKLSELTNNPRTSHFSIHHIMKENIVSTNKKVANDLLKKLLRVCNDENAN